MSGNISDQNPDPVGHLTYMRTISCKPYHEVENEFFEAQRRKEDSSRDNADNSDDFLLRDLREETIYDASNNPFKVHRLFVTSKRGSDYCLVGWVIKEEVSCCMCCKTATPDVSQDRHHCTACGDVVCSSCSSNTTEIIELRTSEKFTVCTRCFKSAVRASFQNSVSIFTFIEFLLEYLGRNRGKRDVKFAQ